ncbi:MAG: TetR/AcrR family transcriptional regulator [Polyangiaceae bacterium]
MGSKNAVGDRRGKKRPGVEEQRRVILDAAVDLFIEHGSRAVSVAQICERADVSRTTFYRCFDDKEQLILRLYQDSVKGPTETWILGNLQRAGGDVDWIRSAIDQLLDAIFENPKIAELIFVESSDPRSPAHEIVRASYEETTKSIERWLGQFTSVLPSRVFIQSILVANQWIAHNAIRQGLTEKSKAEAKDATFRLASSVFQYWVTPRVDGDEDLRGGKPKPSPPKPSPPKARKTKTERS